MTLDGRTRLQFNILVTKSATMSHLTNFKEGSILPILWVEAVSILSIAGFILFLLLVFPTLQLCVCIFHNTVAGFSLLEFEVS